MADITNQLQAAAGGSDPYATGWSLANGLTDPNIRYFNFNNFQSLSSGLYFKPDGTSFFTSNTNGAVIRRYDLSTAWNITTATAVQSFTESGITYNANAIMFKPDGTKFYWVLGSPVRIYEYDTATPWQITSPTLVRTQNLTQITNGLEPYAGYMDETGTRLFIAAYTGQPLVYTYTLSTPWNVSTVNYIGAPRTGNANSYNGVYVDPGGGITFRPDGKRLFVYDRNFNTQRIIQLNLSTPWDVSTSTYEYQSTAPNAYAAGGGPGGIQFKPDGLFIYTATGPADYGVRQFNVNP